MTELELTLDDGRPAVAAHFFRAGSDLLALLDELSDEPVDWILTDLHLGSSVARVSPPSDMPAAGEYLRRTMRGLALVQAGQALPDGWNPDALIAARRLASGEDDFGGAQTHYPRLTLIDGDRGADTVELTGQLALRLADLQPAERSMPGAVRGRVVGVNVARGNRASLKSQGGSVVKVTFADDLRLPLREALYDQVELVGQMRQDSSGRAFHIKADTVRRLTAPNVRWADLFGIDPDFTGGLSVADYLKSARGEA